MRFRVASCVFVLLIVVIHRTLAASSSSLDIGPSFNVGGPPVYEAAARDQFQSAVAFDGTNYFVVWVDWRVSGCRSIYAARVTAEGQVLDPAGVVVSTGMAECYGPAVAFDGINYLVVWHDYRNDGMGYNIRGSRVSASGEVLDPDAIAVSSAPGNQTYPAIAFDGTNYFVAWSDARNGGANDIYAARITQSGQVIDLEGLAISVVGGDQSLPAVAFDGTNYFVAWQDGRSQVSSDIYGARVSSSGAVLDPDGIPVSIAYKNQVSPAIAFHNDTYFVVWEDYRESIYPDIYGARVSSSGEILDSTGLVISATPSLQLAPTIAFDGVDFWVTWTEDFVDGWSDIFGVRVSISGAVLDSIPIAISTSMYLRSEVTLVYGGMSCMAVWTDRRNGNDSDVFASRLDQAGHVIDPDGIAVSMAASNQMGPAAASDGAEYLVVWAESRNRAFGIYAARIEASGALIDREPIPICTSGSGLLDPDVAFDGTNYLVVWGFGRIHGVRISPAGEILDPSPFLISSPQYFGGTPSIAFNGECYLVVWRDGRGILADIYGTRVTVSGEVLDPQGIPIAVYNPYEMDPQVASNGTGFLVTWRIIGDEECPEFYPGIYATAVDGTGKLVDRRQILWWPTGPPPPKVGSDGTNYLVVWPGERDGTSGIFGLRVSESSLPIDTIPFAISSTGQGQSSPDLEFDGFNYRVVWADGRSGTFADIYATRVSPSGEVLDPGGIPLSIDPYSQYDPTIAAWASLNCLVTYQSYTAPPVFGSRRIWANIWGGPTSLTFVSVSAAATGGCVRLSWEMSADVPVSGFSILRADSPEGTFGTRNLLISKGKGSSFSCTDCSLTGDRTYQYKIVLATSSVYQESEPLEVFVEAVPAAYCIYQNFPNPFNPTCTISYDVPKSGRVSLRVFDVRGALVRTLVDSWKEPDTYSETWDGKNEDGNGLPSGVYICRMQAGDFVEARKMVLLR